MGSSKQQNPNVESRANFLTTSSPTHSVKSVAEVSDSSAGYICSYIPSLRENRLQHDMGRERY